MQKNTRTATNPFLTFEKIKKMNWKHFYCLLLLFFMISLSAQTVNFITPIATFTKAQVDSVLLSNQIPPIVVGTRYDVDVYKINYNTLDPDSQPIVASGLLCIPNNAENCKLPIAMYMHGTIVRKESAPSRFNSTEASVGLIAAATGYLGLVPDYLGLGDGPGRHFYQHASSLASACTDMVLASKTAAATQGVETNDQLFLMGYSEGGYACMATHKWIQDHYNGILNVTSSAPMSGAYDMSGIMVDLMLSFTPYSNPHYLPYILLSYNDIYDIYPSPSDFMVAPYDTLLPPLFDGSVNFGSIDAVMPSVPRLILKQSVIDSFENNPNHPLRLALQENDVYNWIPQAPVRMYYTKADEQVPWQNTAVTYASFQQLGVQDFDSIEISTTLSHPAAAPLCIINAKYWFDEQKHDDLLYDLAIVNVTEPDSADGAASVEVGSGSGVYSFNWSNGSTTAAIENLSQGVYYVTIADAQGCLKTDSAIVGVGSSIQIRGNDSWQVYPNPASSRYSVTGSAFRQVTVLDIQGRKVDQQVFAPTNKKQFSCETLPAGVYLLEVEDIMQRKSIQRLVIH